MSSVGVGRLWNTSTRNFGKIEMIFDSRRTFLDSNLRARRDRIRLEFFKVCKMKVDEFVRIIFALGHKFHYRHHFRFFYFRICTKWLSNTALVLFLRVFYKIRMNCTYWFFSFADVLSECIPHVIVTKCRFPLCLFLKSAMIDLTVIKYKVKKIV